MNKDRRREVLRVVREQFRLEWRGIHGVAHWARVRVNGLTMARANGARLDVVELFALLHDSQRHHDGLDLKHGARGADFTLQLNSELLRLDRLDLGRVGIVPRPDRLCTEQARDPVLLDRAYRRSVR